VRKLLRSEKRPTGMSSYVSHIHQ